MKSLLVVALTWFAAVGLGRTLIDLCLRRLPAQVTLLNPGERNVLGSALGLGTIAYGIYALGLLGHLSAASIAILLLVAGLLGIPGNRALWAEFRAMMKRDRSVDTNAKATRFGRLTDAVLVGSLMLLLIIAASACYLAPGPHAWDALAYHLADPKIFLQQHRIGILPTEHHSNFPFTMEMLFAIGLAFDGYAAANLFHLLTAVLLAVGMVLFCDRFLSRSAGLIAALVFASTPIVLWEATVAYIDLGLSLYLFLSAYLLLLGVSLCRTQSQRTNKTDDKAQLWAFSAAGAMMGFALGIKYLAILSFVILLTLALLRRVPVRFLAVFALAAFVVGSPWYIKNIVWMHNPVYPFAYNIFPGSKYWSKERAAPYMDEQKGFGTAHDIKHPTESLRNLAVSPWTLISRPELYANKADFTFTSTIGGIYAAFLLSLAFVRAKPGTIRDLSLIVVAMFVGWFFVSQHVRYLIPILPFAAILCGFAANHWIRVGAIAPMRALQDCRLNIVNSFAAYSTAAAVAGHVCVLGWGITALPVGGREAVLTQERGLEPTALSVPEIIAQLQDTKERDRQLRRLNSYGAAEWINQHVPERAGVILYEDVLGFYLDREYLWGNGEHSSYIPYESFRSGEDLTQWLIAHNIGYALFNLNNTPGNSHPLLPEDLDEINSIMRKSYNGQGEGWRRIVGEAIHSGNWVLRYAHHGVVVLEIGAPGT